MMPQYGPGPGGGSQGRSCSRPAGPAGGSPGTPPDSRWPRPSHPDGQTPPLLSRERTESSGSPDGKAHIVSRPCPYTVSRLHNPHTNHTRLLQNYAFTPPSRVQKPLQFW